jgi:two-component system, OmpR family, alkaline phosphatase synthesis response regulator PhoP
MSRILIVEDEQHLAEGLRFNLRAEEHDVEVVDTGEAALAQLSAEPTRFDLVILDVMLPGINGFGVVSHLRRAGQFVPVLMLTARGRPDDVLQGFESGADDYLPKPFELPILIARVQGLLRRREWFRLGHDNVHRGQPTEPASTSRFTFRERTIDFEQLEVEMGDKTMPLTVMEASLLRYLVEHEGKPVSRKTILEKVWGVREDTDTRAIDNFIVRLRRYLEDDPGSPRHLQTVRGVGYRFVANPE